MTRHFSPFDFRNEFLFEGNALLSFLYFTNMCKHKNKTENDYYALTPIKDCNVKFVLFGQTSIDNNDYKLMRRDFKLRSEYEIAANIQKTKESRFLSFNSNRLNSYVSVNARLNSLLSATAVSLTKASLKLP